MKVSSALSLNSKKKIWQNNSIIKTIWKQRGLHLMAIPGAVWMIIFAYIPMYGVIIAFKDFNILKPISEAPWVGLKHFMAFFNDEKFLQVMRNTIGISFWKQIGGFPLPIIFALLLNELTQIKFKKIVQTVSYLPHFLSWVVLAGIIMNWTSDTGILNVFLQKIGTISTPVIFMGEPEYFWQISILSDIWKEVGWGAIIYIAAITGVDQSLYESAEIDGAGRFARMWHITIASIRGTIAILFILSVGSILDSNFDQIFVLSNPLNQSSSDVIDVFVYRMGIKMRRYSFSAAVGFFRAVMAMGLLVIANITTKKLTDSSLF